MTWPIYMPTKGRAGTVKTHGLNLTLVVEPQEQDAYAATGLPLIVLAHNDGGLPYVREQLKQRLTEQGVEWFWMLDDDITRFSKVEGKKLVKIDASEALDVAEGYAGVTKHVGQMGLEYGQFAWSATKPYALGSYCDVAVAIHAQRTKRLHFRQLPLKVDRDFTMQVLAEGMDTVRVQRVAFEAPTNGSNQGGLAADYAMAGKEAADAAKLAEFWPGFATVVTKPSGRVDAKINWRAFRR